MGSREALADPIRLEITRHLTTHPNASATELATAAGVHLNTARAHLAVLEDAGMVERATDSGGRRGRPVVRYMLTEVSSPPSEEVLSLSKLLATALRSTTGGGKKLRDAAREWGQQWAAMDTTIPVERRLAASLTRLGFQVRVGRGRLALSACPCPHVAPGDPALVCAVADAVTDGVLEGSGLAARAHNHDPRARRCSTALGTASQSTRQRRRSR